MLSRLMEAFHTLKRWASLVKVLVVLKQPCESGRQRGGKLGEELEAVSSFNSLIQINFGAM